MKKLFLILALALILISSTESFASSSKFGFLADSSQNLNSLRFFYAQNLSAVDTGSSKYVDNKNLRLKDPNKAILFAISQVFFFTGQDIYMQGKQKQLF